MNLVSIEDLPNEIILHIFQYLDASSVRNCRLVSASWNLLIQTSPCIMRMFQLNLDSVNWRNRIDDILALTTEFHSLAIRQESITEEMSNLHTLKVVQRHGAKLREFSLDYARIYNLQSFFQHTMLLDTLDLRRISVNSDVLPERIELPHLKHLSVSNVDDSIVRPLVSGRNLITLKAKDIKSRDLIMSILQSSPALRVFEIGSASFSTLFAADDVLNLPFKLDSFSISMQLSVAQYFENFRKFLTIHAASLNNLGLHMALSSIENALDIFAIPFPNLVSFSVNVDFLPSDKEFYNIINPLESVSSLKLVGKFARHEIAKYFFLLFPSIKNLDMTQLITSLWFPKFLKAIAASHNNLQRLSIANLFTGTPPNLHFESLTSFTVMSIHNCEIFLNFVRNHRELEEISILRSYQPARLTAKEAESLLDLPNIKKLAYQGSLDEASEIFKGIKKDYKNLRDFSFGKDLRRKITFPENKDTWKHQRYDHMFTAPQ